MSDTKGTERGISLDVVDTHLDYLRRDVAKLVEAVAQMATRDDIKRLEGQMGQFATRDELRALEAKIKLDSAQSTFERWTSNITKLGSAAAVVGGGFVLVLHLMEKLK